MRSRVIPAVTVVLLQAGLASAQAPAGPVATDGGSRYLTAPVAASCGPACAADRGPADQDGSFRVSAEYLLWTVRGRVPPELSGVLSGAGFDANSLLSTLPLESWRSGFRGFATFAPADDLPVFEVGGFFLENNRGSFDATVVSHPGSAPAAVPAALLLQPVIGGVIDVADSRGIVDSPVPGPGGTVDLDPSDTLTSHLRGTSQRQLWGLEANLRSRGCYFGGLRLDGLAGFRYVNLREKLTVLGDFTFAEPPAGGDADESPTNPEDTHANVMHTTDTIEVRNNFYAGQIGASFEACVCDRVIIGGFAKVALGGNWERVSRAGSTLLDATTIETNAGGPFVPRPTTLLPGGLFTPQVAGGITTRTTHLAVMPDLNINIGYQITPNVQAYVGYNYLYLSNVARIGSQSLASTTSGQGHLNLHGADFGLQFRY